MSLKGWVNGYPEGDFKPDNPVTRVEAVCMVNAAFNRRTRSKDIPANVPVFSDLSKSHWGYSAMMEAAVAHEFTRQKDGYEKWTKIWKP